MKFQKGLNNIHILLFWFAGLLFFSHSVVSHHHHFDSVNEPNHRACNSDGQSEDDLLHCHAFNLLIIEKIKVSTNKVSNENPFIGITVKNDFCYQIIKNSCGEIKYSNQNDVIYFIGYLKNSPTRGSPYLV